MTSLSGVLRLARMVAAARTVTTVARAATRAAPLATPPQAPATTISVVVPARDEAGRIGPLLDSLRDCPGVVEVIVVDDESSDGTGRLARDAGAVVVEGTPPPAGWQGKPWALQQGLDAAAGEWVVMLDADTRADRWLPAALVTRALADGVDLVSASGRFECPTTALRWLHPALLTTIVYRFPAPGQRRAPRARRVLANGQCLAARRTALLDAGGLRPVRGHVVEDVALARSLAAAGWSVGMVEGRELLTVRMYETARDAATGWSRSLSLPGVDTLGRRLADLTTVALTQALPLTRVLTRRADTLDLALLAVRLGTLAGTAGSYQRRGLAYWVSPTADVAAVGVLAAGLLRRHPTWRGRRC